MQDDYGTEYVTTRELYERVDATYDALDAKIAKVDDKLDIAREQTAKDLATTREEMATNFSSLKAWVRFWPVIAVALGTVGGEQVAQALSR